MAQGRSWNLTHETSEERNKPLWTAHGRGRGKKVRELSQDPQGVKPSGIDPSVRPRGRSRGRARRPDQPIYVPGALRRERLKGNVEKDNTSVYLIGKQGNGTVKSNEKFEDESCLQGPVELIKEESSSTPDQKNDTCEVAHTRTSNNTSVCIIGEQRNHPVEKSKEIVKNESCLHVPVGGNKEKSCDQKNDNCAVAHTTTSNKTPTCVNREPQNGPGEGTKELVEDGSSLQGTLELVEEESGSSHYQKNDSYTETQAKTFNENSNTAFREHPEFVTPSDTNSESCSEEGSCSPPQLFISSSIPIDIYNSKTNLSISEVNQANEIVTDDSDHLRGHNICAQENTCSTDADENILICREVLENLLTHVIDQENQKKVNEGKSEGERKKTKEITSKTTKKVKDKKGKDKTTKRSSKEKKKKNEKEQKTLPKKHVSGEEESEDDWDANFDESGECINPELIKELSNLTGIKKPSVRKTQFDFYAFTPKEVDLDEDPAYSHILEIYDFSPELQTKDVSQALAMFTKQGYNIMWVDDTHALAVFSSEITAKQAIQSCSSPLLKLRPISQGIQASKSKARNCLEFLLPYKERPKTTNLTANRLVAGALGMKSSMTKEQRQKEREKLKEAREQRQQEKQRKAEVWGDDF
ncbi:coiled-coil domain-containing protein R3HCC1L isoform X2 [Nematostella vectensis]|nr:coiled-coil domain-containing protein R3HCC1L isoform X2 [Nematostella vectensis]